MYKVVGKTIENPAIVFKRIWFEFKYRSFRKNIWRKIKYQYLKLKTKDVEEKVETVLYDNKSVISPAIKIAKPRVVIPVFPGTNCEYDCARAFEKEGAEVTQVSI